MIKIEIEKEIEIEKTNLPMEKLPLPQNFNRHKKRADGTYFNEDNNISYQINTKDYYVVHKRYLRGKPIYMLPVRKRYYNRWRYGYKPIRFMRGIELEDKSIIRIVEGFEDLDIKSGVNMTTGNYKYTTSIIVITDFEVYETPELLEKKALKDYELQKQDKFEVHR